MPNFICVNTAAVVGDLLFVFGGDDGHGALYNDGFTLDVASGTKTETSFSTHFRPRGSGAFAVLLAGFGFCWNPKMRPLSGLGALVIFTGHPDFPLQNSSHLYHRSPRGINRTDLFVVVFSWFEMGETCLLGLNSCRSIDAYTFCYTR